MKINNTIVAYEYFFINIHCYMTRTIINIQQFETAIIVSKRSQLRSYIFLYCKPA